MTSVFLWTPKIKAQIRKVRAHAEKRENWYLPGGSIPGDNPAFVIHAGTIRAVFTWTVAPFGVLRHLTVSVRTQGRSPLPIVVFTLAHHLGFTGAKPDRKGFVEEPGPWQAAFDQSENCAILQELVQPDPLRSSAFH